MRGNYANSKQCDKPAETQENGYLHAYSYGYLQTIHQSLCKKIPSVRCHAKPLKLLFVRSLAITYPIVKHLRR